jgi:ABC-type Fe3+/spermidine/putrescine transport system ATPase subunit
MPRTGSLPKAGGGALVSLRPERIRLLSTGASAEQITEGTLISHTFLGRHARSVVAALAQTLAISTTDVSAAVLGEGGSVRLGWNYDDAQLLAGGLSTDNKGGTHA